MSDCKVKGLKNPGKCEDCGWNEDEYCTLLDKGISAEKKPLRCEDCEFYFALVGGCDKAQYFVLRKQGEDRPSWCPLDEKGEEDGQA